jgi:hypothetical protein
VTVHTATDVAAIWTRAAGSSERAVEWVAISMGESSLDDSVVSSAGAIGLWQIMPFNAHWGGGSVSDLYDPDYNARVAVLMSGNGANCAAWDSCYLDINRSGRYSYLGWPERGSADWNNLVAAGALIGSNALANALPEPSLGISVDVARIAAGVQQLITSAFPQLRRDTLTENVVLTRMYQPGWRAWMSSGR